MFFINDTEETYSSFERFENFNAANTSAVESVLLTYNFLIVLPHNKKAQNYKLSIRIASKVAVRSQMNDYFSLHIPKVIRIMGNRTATVKIEYVDYAVAGAMMNVVDNWFNSLNQSENSKLLKFFSRKSYTLPMLSRYTVGLSVAYLIYDLSSVYLPANTTLYQLFSFSLWSSVALLAAYHLAHYIGRASENSLDQWFTISYLKLTAGDEKLIKSAINSNKKSIVKASIKFIGALLIAVLSGLLTKLFV